MWSPLWSACSSGATGSEAYLLPLDDAVVPRARRNAHTAGDLRDQDIGAGYVIHVGAEDKGGPLFRSSAQRNLTPMKGDQGAVRPAQEQRAAGIHVLSHARFFPYLPREGPRHRDPYRLPKGNQQPLPF